MNQPISDYKIVSHSNINSLEQDVKQLIKEGWEPLGGLAALSVAEAASFAQAMIHRGNKLHSTANLHHEPDTELGLE